MNKKELLELKKDLEKNLLNGWQDIYGQFFSNYGFIEKDKWDKFWGERQQQGGSS